MFLLVYLTSRFPRNKVGQQISGKYDRQDCPCSPTCLFKTMQLFFFMPVHLHCILYWLFMFQMPEVAVDMGRQLLNIPKVEERVEIITKAIEFLTMNEYKEI